MKVAQKSLNVMLATSCFMGFSSCSQKADFSERPRGEDPYHVDDGLSGENSADQGASHPGDSSPGLRQKTDHFNQVNKTKLDVLWVIDNSASMAPYQEMLANNIDAFLDSAHDWSADIQMGVTSTDMCTAKRPSDLTKVMCPDKAETTPGLRGKLSKGKVIRGMDDLARSDFANLARLGTAGSSFEHGLSAAKSAVELSLAGQNAGLVRGDSFLSVVLVSDEEDDGVGLSKKDEEGRNWVAEGKTKYRFTADDLISYLKSVRPDGQFSVSSVVGFSRINAEFGPCGSNGSLEVGSEQLRASALSGGFRLDICSTDWANGLGAMAENFVSQLSSFKLSIKPLTGADIEVYVDGDIKKTGWTYIESRQSIVFDTKDLPEFGARIDVRYRY